MNKYGLMKGPERINALKVINELGFIPFNYKGKIDIF